jgi:CubicO group peptidase (beta-lactamase class C family)
MRNRRIAVAVITLLLGLLPALARAFAAEVEPTGKFSRAPTGWNWFAGNTPAQVGTILTNGQQRIVDIHVVQANPLLLTGSTVSNVTWPYGIGWWWYFGVSASQVGSFLNTNHARLTNLKGYSVNGTTVYLPIMVDNTGSNGRAWSWFPDTSPAALQSFLSSTGDRLIDVSTWLDGNGARHYAGVTLANSGSDHLALPAGVPQFQDQQTAVQIKAFLVAQLAAGHGARVLDLEDEGGGRFLVLYAFDAKVPNSSLSSSAVAPDSWYYDGLTLGVGVLAERSFNHVFQATGGRVVSLVLDPSEPQSGLAGFDVALLQQQALPAMSALPAPNNDGAGQFDYLDNRLRTFLRQYGVVGAGIAIAKGGKLVYTRAYGTADTEQNGGTAATPNTLFRIGSISKFVTTQAILRMIDEGTLTHSGLPLTLDTKIFPEVIRPYLGISVAAEGSAASAPGGGLEAMTLRDLLHHAGGYDDANLPGPCGGNPLVQTSCIAAQVNQATTPSCKDLIARWMVNKQLAYGPGTTGLYSNFGFCVAMTVVDALQPSGYQGYISSRFINGIPLIDQVHGVAQLAPGSDSYAPATLVAHDYGYPWQQLVANQLVPANPAQVDPPYGGVPLFPGLGTGGWKASPVGLLKLAVSVNQSTAAGQVISAARFGSIFDAQGIIPAITGGNFGLGTEINLGNGDVYKTGGVAGGGGILVYRGLLNSYAGNSCAGCITWVALVNTAGGGSDPDGPGGINLAMIDALSNSAVLDAVNSATVDLFPAYGLPAGQ